MFNLALEYPDPLRIQGESPHAVPLETFPKRQYPQMIEAIKGSAQTAVRVISYSTCIGFVEEYGGYRGYNLLVYLIKHCDVATQNEMLAKIHPFELAKMSHIGNETIQFEPSTTFGFMNKKGDFVNRLTQQAHFFVLFEHLRAKHRYCLQDPQQLNMFITLVQAAYSQKNLPQLGYFYSFVDSTFSAIYTALLTECTEQKQTMQADARKFIEFIRTDLELEQDEFSKKFLLQLNFGLVPEHDNSSSFEMRAFTH